jgi:hypothetical protein
VIPTSNQDGRQAKNTKGGMKLKKNSPLKLLNQIFLFLTASFKYTYRAPLRQIGQE